MYICFVLSSWKGKYLLLKLLNFYTFFSISYYLCSTAQRTAFSRYLHGDHWWGDLRASSDAARCIPAGGCYFHPLLWHAWRTCGWWLYLKEIVWGLDDKWKSEHTFLTPFLFEQIYYWKPCSQWCLLESVAFIFRKVVVISENYSSVPFFQEKSVNASPRLVRSTSSHGKHLYIICM